MENCPELTTLDRWRDDPALASHVGTCSGCAAVIQMMEERAEVLAAEDCSMFEPLLAAHLDHKLDPDDARLLDDHLALCLDCAAMMGTLAPAPEREPDPASADPEIERDAYDLGKEIARGGMGRILAAEDRRIGRPVAIKELLVRTPALAARFDREARMTARLQHPGIIPIYEIGTWADGTPFYAMRPVAGRTLRDVLRDASDLAGRLAALPSLIAAADAVAYAHARNCIHRDLKPSNILIGDHGDTVVIDWGLAKDLTASAGDLGDRLESLHGIVDTGLTTAGTVMGTPAFMPPEQAAGEAVDRRADVYALGAVLYNLLTGGAPYHGSKEVLRSVKQGPPVPVDQVEPEAPRELVRITARAMARVAGERYQDAGELADDLRRFHTGTLVEANAHPSRQLLRRWMRHNRAGLVALAVALLALVVVGVFTINRIVDERDRARSEARAADQLKAALGCKREITAVGVEPGGARVTVTCGGSTRVLLVERR